MLGLFSWEQDTPCLHILALQAAWAQLGLYPLLTDINKKDKFE